MVKYVSIMLVVVKGGDKLLKSEFVRGWVNHVLVVDKSAMKKSGNEDLLITR